LGFLSSGSDNHQSTASAICTKGTKPNFSTAGSGVTASPNSRAPAMAPRTPRDNRSLLELSQDRVAKWLRIAIGISSVAWFYMLANFIVKFW
jgi:hypothetical protein